MNPLPHIHAELVLNAIRSAQQAGDLPEFDIPTIVISRPRLAEQGDYSSAVAMSLTKTVGRKPLDIAETIAKYLPEADFIADVEVVPPGFINFRLSETWLRAQVERIIELGDQFGKVNFGTGLKAQVEFLSANPTGPLTIGRTRGAILGEGISRVLEAAGYDVTREYYFNNAGAQMRRLGESLQIRYLEALGEPVELPSQDDENFYQGAYLIEFAQRLIGEVGDAWKDADWQPFKEYAEKQIFQWIRQTLDRVNIKHDVFFNENSLYDDGSVETTLNRLREKGYIYESPFREQATDEEKAAAKDLAPAVWFRSTLLGDTEDRVVVKSSGEPTYTLPDIAYHINKIERGFDLLVNVLGSDHKKEAEVVRLGLEALGYRTDHLNVVFMQMVHLRRQGEEIKMSTRKANYITLDQMIDETSADAIQYFMAHRSADAQFVFDLDLAVKQSNENPVYYIQYAYVRCAGIFREAEARGVTDEGADLSLLGEEALNFIRKCLELPEIVEYAARNLSPHSIAHFAGDVANHFHPLYDKVRAFGEGISPEHTRANLRFYRVAQITLANLLTLMGMSIPERM